MKYSAHVAMMIVLVAGSACGPMADNTRGTSSADMMAKDKQAIDQVRSDYVTAWNAGDAAGIANLYAADAMAFPGNQPTVTGKDAILKYNQDFFAQFMPEKIELMPEETRMAGDMAFDRGTYQVMAMAKAGGQKMAEHGRYLVVMQKQADGSWKVTRDFDNTDSAPPAPNAAQ